MISDKAYQKVYNELDKYLLKGWERLVIYLEYGNASYSISFYVKKGGEYMKCYDLPGVSEESLSSSFARIDSVVSKEREKLNSMWSNMTIVTDAKGNMQADIDYTDLSEGTYKYKKEWKKKYLI